jgi:two-component system, OmpR family, sensor histidine kinase ChvG
MLTRARKQISPLTLRILAINVLALALLLAGLLYLDQYREGLLEAKIDALATNGTIIAGALGEAAGNDARGLPVLNPRGARTMVRRLVSLTGARARLFDDQGHILADSRVLISAGREVTARPLETDQADAKSLHRRFGDWLGHVFHRRHDLPPYKDNDRQSADNFEEARDALQGEAGQSRRVTDDGEVIVSVAIPVQSFKKILGALMLSAGTADVERLVAEARLAILGVFVVALGVTVLLSLYLAASIVRPLHHLAEAAETVRQHPGQRESIPDLRRRGDEIGDLSGALWEMTTALYQRLDAIEGFAADVAHEIRNPLTSIKSAVEVLEMSKDEDAQARLLAIINDDIRRLDRLIGDISDASRLDAELARSEPQPLDLIALCETLIDMARTTSDSNVGPIFELVIENELGIEATKNGALIVPGMADRLGQVVRNLLDNATSFSPPQGLVRIRVIDAGSEAKLIVEDEGPGIPVGKFDAVFERFYSERPAGEDFGVHSGLGLSISQQIVLAHDGSIIASNRTGDDGAVSGARFEVRLPKDNPSI